MRDLRWMTLAIGFALCAPAQGREGDMAAMLRRLDQSMANVVFERTAAREAFDWWSRETGVSLVVNWPALESEGLQADAPITLKLSDVPARQVLVLIARLFQPDEPMFLEVTPHYIRVMSGGEAEQEVVLRVYDVSHLLDEPARRHLGGRFVSRERTVEAPSLGAGASRIGSREASGAALAQMIRDMIEPHIWQENGGQYASIRYHRGRLIVNAPPHVHGRLERVRQTIRRR